MGISVFHETPQGRVLVNSDIVDVAKRLQEGDPTCLWEGDPRLHVAFNPKTQQYEVWRYCEDNKDRIISSWKPEEFDARVIKHIAEHDTRVHDVLARVDKENARKGKADREKAVETEAEIKKYLSWARKKLYLPGEDAPRPRV